jgi:hypothetical protein
VIWDGFTIGRIYSTHGVGVDLWNWLSEAVIAYFQSAGS